jgi:NhaA family Na+:H+ antiporter
VTDQPTIDRRSLPPFVRRFLDTEAAGGIVLVVATVVAVVWANSAWRDTYASLWHTAVDVRLGTFGFTGDVHALVNDGLMAVFFLVVGLEIKRELVTGDLRDPRVAALPAVAALGGMLVPALLFVAFTAGGPGSNGWGVPMATDIAFAVGVLALLGSRVNAGLKLFLLSLAIVDDIGAIVVIAVFYAGGVKGTALVVAAALFLAAVALRTLRVHWLPIYVVLGAGCWLALHESGVHATIAGVAFGLLAPARPVGDEHVSSAEQVERALHPLTSFVIVPLFALANAGVELRSSAFDAPGATRVALGVGLGLVVGKLVGVLGASWLAVRTGIATRPVDATWPAIAGIAAVAGIGFTVSLFVTGLAFDDPALADAAKLAILAASIVAALMGAGVLSRASRAQPEGNTSDA